MPTTEGRILQIESKKGTNDSGKAWELISVHLQDKATGREEVFTGFLPLWQRFVGKEGTQWEILWEPDPKYPSHKNIKGGTQKAIPTEDQLTGEDKPKRSDRDDQIAMLALSHDAVALASAWGTKHSESSDLRPWIAAWSAAYHSMRQELGYEQ